MRAAMVPVWLVLGLTLGMFFAALGTPAHATGGDLAPILNALTDADAEIRDSIIPAYSGVLTAIVLIGVAGAVVAVVTRGR